MEQDTAEHIPVERMREVVWNSNASLTETEQQHILHCAECLTMFGRLVMSKAEYGSS